MILNTNLQKEKDRSKYRQLRDKATQLRAQLQNINLTDNARDHIEERLKLIEEQKKSLCKRYGVDDLPDKPITSSHKPSAWR